MLRNAPTWLVVIMLLGTLLAEPSFACSRLRQPKEADDFRKATYVFHALVVDTHLLDFTDPSNELTQERSIVNATYELKTKIKGDVPRRGRVTGQLLGACTIPLLAGYEYIFFVFPWPDAAPDDVIATSLGLIGSIPTFTRIASDETDLDDEIKRLLSLGAR